MWGGLKVVLVQFGPGGELVLGVLLLDWMEEGAVCAHSEHQAGFIGKPLGAQNPRSVVAYLRRSVVWSFFIFGIVSSMAISKLRDDAHFPPAPFAAALARIRARTCPEASASKHSWLLGRFVRTRME